MKYITLFVLAICSPICLAVESNSTVKTLTVEPLPTGALLETLLGLLVVLGCIAFLAWLLKRTGRFQTTANGNLKILAGLSLGPRERAVLLQVGEQQILVGVTAHNIQTLHILETPIETKASNTNTSTINFADKLQQIMQQRKSS